MQIINISNKDQHRPEIRVHPTLCRHSVLQLFELYHSIPYCLDQSGALRAPHPPADQPGPAAPSPTNGARYEVR